MASLNAQIITLPGTNGIHIKKTVVTGGSNGWGIVDLFSSSLSSVVIRTRQVDLVQTDSMTAQLTLPLSLSIKQERMK